MSSKQTPAPQAQLSSDMFGMFGPAMDYMIDAAQRTVLFWDVMRQRGNQYREHMAETVPNVLELRGGAHHRWANPQTPGELWPRAHRSAAGRDHRSSATPVHDRRSPRRPRSRYWRVQGRQRNRCRSSRRVILVISSAFCPNQCRGRPSRILRAPRRSSWRR